MLKCFSSSRSGELIGVRRKGLYELNDMINIRRVFVSRRSLTQTPVLDVLRWEGFTEVDVKHCPFRSFLRYAEAYKQYISRFRNVCVVVKVIRISRTPLESIASEVRSITRLNHAALNASWGSVIVKGDWIMFLQNNAGESLVTCLRHRAECRNPSFVLQVAVALLEAVVAISHNSNIYREVTPSHVRINENLRLSLVDFSRSRSKRLGPDLKGIVDSSFTEGSAARDVFDWAMVVLYVLAVVGGDAALESRLADILTVDASFWSSSQRALQIKLYDIVSDCTLFFEPHDPGQALRSCLVRTVVIDYRCRPTAQELLVDVRKIRNAVTFCESKALD
ncbi:MAG: uncharacterized protein KVP18_001267 [Porospora cf. gigantea A]|uniref:uncharacterized protein n=1 Tax=Porospora cf. gigantea A TaxID=2853593 RepID=UPI003559DD45|nr:MAG: hypothetical protein KVP18_001267 [Porospora cf. gigantea A]